MYNVYFDKKMVYYRTVKIIPSQICHTRAFYYVIPSGKMEWAEGTILRIYWQTKHVLIPKI